MTAAALVATLLARGVTLTSDGHLLRCRPKSALTKDDLAALRERKLEVIGYLRAEAGRLTGKVRCYACRGSRFWRSTYGEIVCGRCHPPADASLVLEWIGLAPEGDVDA